MKTGKPVREREKKGAAANMEPSTGIFRHREWRGLRDTAYDFGKWAQLWGILIAWALAHPRETGEEAVLPDEVIVLSTLRGAREVEASLPGGTTEVPHSTVTLPPPKSRDSSGSSPESLMFPGRGVLGQEQRAHETHETHRETQQEHVREHSVLGEHHAGHRA